MNEIVKVFKKDGKLIRSITKNGKPWFVANDVAACLGIKHIRDAVSDLDDDEKDAVDIVDTIGRNQKTTIISESGVYEIAILSRKESAKEFKRWIRKEVLPSIRATGSYSLPASVSLVEQTSHPHQIQNSKNVNRFNLESRGKDAMIEYNRNSAVARTGMTPSKLKEYGKHAGLKSKQRSSGKEVIRNIWPEKRAGMSLQDELINMGFRDEEATSIGIQAEPVYKRMIELGINIKELASAN